MTFWCGFGSVSGSRCQQKTNLKKVFLHITCWRYFYIILQRLKVKTKSQNSRNQGFSYYFCLMIEGSGSGSIPVTNGSRSGSRRPKNMWIRIRIRIRIRNTAFYERRFQTHKGSFLLCLLHGQALHELSFLGWRIFLENMQLCPSRCMGR